MPNTKTHRKHAALFIALMGLLLVLLIVHVSGGVDAVKLSSIEDAAQYAADLGWTVSRPDMSEQKTVLPETFNAVYREYNALQQRQGYDLQPYAGKAVVIYSLPITDYPGENGVCISLVTCRGKLIGGDIHSSAMSGFIHELKGKEAP